VTNNKAILVGLCRDARELMAEEESLEELARLAETAGARVLDVVLQRRPKPDPTLFIGKGKAQELAEGISRAGAGLVIFDHNLSPGQAQNLEKVLGCRVLDRAELIMDIFAMHARSAEARIQVELAQLQYRFSRLVGAGLEMTDPGAGIGTRGPGEKQLELDRRKIRSRIARLKQELKKVEVRRRTQRKSRSAMFRAAVVGYTNAGKSSLMNLMSKSGLKVADRLFATLDPATRLVVLPSGQRFLLTDTVGFIRRLPHQLVASFRSTLEEAVEADLVLHVVDCAHPARDRQMQAVRQVLQEIGARSEELTVYNKTDLAEDRVLGELAHRDPGACFVSALTGEGRKGLEAALVSRMAREAGAA
jgi:GTP-binding protein HflX